MLDEEFLKPLGITQADFARRIGVPVQRVNLLVNGRRGVSPDTALRLERALGMPASFWIGLQQDWDLWHALHSPEGAALDRIERLPELSGASGRG
jgi:addiction module HigA family antidote